MSGPLLLCRYRGGQRIPLRLGVATGNCWSDNGAWAYGTSLPQRLAGSTLVRAGGQTRLTHISAIPERTSTDVLGSERHPNRSCPFGNRQTRLTPTRHARPVDRGSSAPCADPVQGFECKPTPSNAFDARLSGDIAMT